MHYYVSQKSSNLKKCMQYKKISVIVDIVIVTHSVILGYE